jgi:cell division protein FtsI/penicillin-binding protein 2
VGPLIELGFDGECEMKRKDSKKKQIRTDVSALLAFLSAFIGAFLRFISVQVVQKTLKLGS